MAAAIGVVLNEEKPQAFKTGQLLYHWLSRRDIEIYFVHETAELVGYPECGLGEKDLIQAVDFLVSLGGDGTLYAARIAGASEAILGKSVILVSCCCGTKKIYHSLKKYCR